MPDPILATTAPVSAVAGTAPADGPAGTAPAGSVSTQSDSAGEPRPAPETTTDGQPAPPGAAPARLFTDLDHAEKQYKEVQAWNTRISQQLARLSKYGDLAAVENMLHAHQVLVADPGFQEFARARVAESRLGTTPDPETQKALDLVEQIATQKADEAIGPLKDYVAGLKIKDGFQAMTQKYGKEWETFKPAMKALLDAWLAQGWLSPEMDTNPPPEFIETVYLAVRGKDPNFGATQYQQRLERQKALTTTASPGTAPGAVGATPVKSMDDAYQLARRQLGLT